MITPPETRRLNVVCSLEAARTVCSSAADNLQIGGP